MGLHVAIVPDGNRRWAKSRGLPLEEGHRAGACATEAILRSSATREVDWLTFWGASVDNLTKRSTIEVGFLNAFIASELRRIASDRFIQDERIRIRVIGQWSTYCSPEVQEAANAVMATTSSHDGQSLTLLLAYDGVCDMVDAITRIAERARTDPEFVVTPEAVKGHLGTAELPPVDLIIRTGGEPHLSAGFLMWESANAQLYFTDRLWPDFDPEAFGDALEEYRSRERRFGA